MTERRKIGLKKQNGQVIVEFAIILPLFLMIMYGIIYSGLLFHDYSTLSNIARASAREAALSEPSNYDTIIENYTGLLNNLKTSFYTVDSEHPIVIEEITADNSVRVTINMNLSIKGYFVEMVMPPTFGMQYYMRKEPASSSSSS